MPSVNVILRDAAEELEAAGVAESRREAASLLAFALDRDKTFLYSHPEYSLTTEESARYLSYIERRASREPFQYIVGKQEFYGLDFEVTPEVLIPRPETEMLVGRAIEILRSRKQPTMCEVGVGSGCIAVSILHNVGEAKGLGLDISTDALKIAARNAEKNNVAERLELKTSDVFSALEDDKFNVIASNPPYVRSADLEALQAEVRDFEPPIALTDGSDGLSIIRRIVDGSPRFLKPGGSLLMEIGFDQGYMVRRMFGDAIWADVEIVPDFQGIPRMVLARIN